MTISDIEGKIGVQHIRWHDGLTDNTFDLLTSTGGTQTYTKFGNTVDVCAAYGSGTTKTSAIINLALSMVGGSKQIGLEFAPGDWVISANVTFPSTITPIIHPGCRFQIATGITVTMPVQPVVGDFQWIELTGTGVVSFTTIDYVKASWYGFAPGASAAVNGAAIAAAMATTKNVFITHGSYNYDTTIACNSYQELECNFSDLTYTGTGNAVTFTDALGLLFPCMRNAWIKGNANATAGVYIYACFNGLFENIKVTGFSTGKGFHLYGNASAYGGVYRNTFINCQSGASGLPNDYGWYLESATSTKAVNSNTFLECQGIYNTTTGLYGRYIQRNKWIGMAESNGAYGIDIDNGNWNDIIVSCEANTTNDVLIGSGFVNNRLFVKPDGGVLGSNSTMSGDGLWAASNIIEGGLRYLGSFDANIITASHVANLTDIIFYGGYNHQTSNFPLAITAAGDIYWGSGSGSRDVRLSRSAADVLKLYDSLTIDYNCTVTGFLNTPPKTATLDAAGAITATASYMVVDTYESAASDDLVTINGGTAGDRLIIRASDAGRTVVVKHGTGNIYCGADFSLDNNKDTITLLRVDANDWIALSTMSNGT